MKVYILHITATITSSLIIARFFLISYNPNKEIDTCKDALPFFFLLVGIPFVSTVSMEVVKAIMIENLILQMGTVVTSAVLLATLLYLIIIIIRKGVVICMKQLNG